VKSPSARHGWAALGVALLLQLAAGVVFGSRAPLAFVAAASALSFLVAAVGVGVTAGLRPAETLSLRRPDLAGVLVAFAGAVALHFVLRAAAPAVEDLLRRLNWETPALLEEFVVRVRAELERSPVAVLLTVAALPALCEETLFRGILLSGLRRSHGAGPALVLSSAIFAAVHVAPLRVVLTFALGLYFALVVLSTRSLWPAILAHFTNNVLALIVPETLPGRNVIAIVALPVLVAVVAVLRRRYVRLSSGGLAE